MTEGVGEDLPPAVAGGDVETIRVVHVDDERSVRELTTDLLPHENDAIEVLAAGSAAEAVEIIEREQVDCVVSDYQMPVTNGLELLADVRDRWGDLPFILFTGKGSEQIASRAITAGVTDYLGKQGGPDQYALLANRIVNAVERWRARKAVEEAHLAIETAREGISILDENGRFTYVNGAYADMYGYERAELLGEHWEVIYREADVENIYDEVLPTLESEGTWAGETVGKRKDGSTFREDHRLATTDTGGLVSVVREMV